MSHIKSEPACGNSNNFYLFLTDDFESSVEIAQLESFKWKYKLSQLKSVFHPVTVSLCCYLHAPYPPLKP